MLRVVSSRQNGTCWLYYKGIEPAPALCCDRDATVDDSTYAVQAFSKLLQVLSVLPQCVDVVEGVLGADLIGFHTYNYLCHRRTLHFLPLLNCNFP